MAKPLPAFDEIEETLPEFDGESLPEFDGAEDFPPQAKKALKTAPIKLPDLPKPRVPGLTEVDLSAPKPGSVGETYEAIGGGPDSTVAKVTRPLTRTADWMMEGMESGPPKILSGYKKLASREGIPLDERAQGGADMIAGIMEATRPILPKMVQSLPGMLKQAPVRTVAEVTAGLGAPPLVHKAGEALDAPPGVTNLLAETSGVIPLGSLAKRTQAATLSPPAAAPPRLPEVPGLPGKTAATMTTAPAVAPLASVPKVSKRTKGPRDPAKTLAKLQKENAGLKTLVTSKVVDKPIVDKPAVVAPEIPPMDPPMGDQIPELPPAPEAPRKITEESLVARDLEVAPTLVQAKQVVVNLADKASALSSKLHRSRYKDEEAARQLEEVKQLQQRAIEVYEKMFGEASPEDMQAAMAIKSKLQREIDEESTRPALDILSDESGSLNVDRVLDLFSKAKAKLTSKDPYSEKADAKADEGRITTGTHKAYTDYVRETHPVWAMQHLVTEIGRDLNLPITSKLGEDIPIPVEDQPAVLMESFSGTMGKVALKLMEVQDKLKPFTGHSAYTTSPVMFPAGAPGKVELAKPSILKEALEYGIRERHLERGTKPLVDPKTGEEFEYKLPNGESLVDNLMAMRKYEAESGPQKMQEIHSALKAYREILSEQWDRLKDAGLISKEFYESAKLFNEKYIPFMRLDFVLKELSNDRTVPLGSKVFQVAEKEFQHHLMGSEREILDPMIGLVRSIYRTEFALAKNKISTSIANLADLPGGKDWVIPINPRTGKPNPIKDASGKKLQPGVPLGFEPISYIKDGKKQQVMVPKDVAEIVRSQDQEGMNAITRMMGFWGSMLRASVVSHPRFWASNMSRDYWTAVTTTGLDPVNWAKGFIGAFTRDIPQEYVPKYLERLGVGDAMYKQFLESGAAYGGAFENTSLPKTADNILDPFWKSAAKKIWNPIEGKGLIGKLPGVGLAEWSGQTAELVPRLAVQNKTLKQGKSKFESGWIARNSTINFAIGGAAMKSWYSIIPFLKGRTGAARTGIEYTAKHPGLSAMRLGINLGIPAVTLYYANVLRYPEVWDSLDDDIKWNHLIHIKGNEKDSRGRYTNIVSIPVDGIPAAFLGALTAGMEAIRGKDVAGWTRNAIQFFSDLSPVGFTRKGKFSFNEMASAVTPPPVSALYSLGTGKDLYTGRDLERRPGVRRDAAPEDRYNLSAKKPLVAASKVLSKAGLEVSPHVLEETPSDLFGHWGRFAVDAMPPVEDDGKNTVQRGMDAMKLHPFTKPLPQRPELELDVQDVTQSRGSRFQDMSREIEAILKSKDKLSEAKARFQGLVERYPDRPPELLAQEYEQMIQRMAKAKAQGMDATERMLYGAPSESRATLIDKALQQLPANRRASVWERWVKLKLVTPKVKAELDLLREQRRRLKSAPVTK